MKTLERTDFLLQFVWKPVKPEDRPKTPEEETEKIKASLAEIRKAEEKKPAVRVADIVITVTGDVNVVSGAEFSAMKDGVIVANTGHFNDEIDIPALERQSQDLAVARVGVRLHLRLELVVARYELVRAAVAEDARELAADAAVPVDQRAVAVERRPAIGHGARA